MANRYFRNVSGTWNTASNWSTTNGGGADAAVPTAADAVFITSLSFATLNLNATAVCASIDFTGYSGTWTGTAGITVSGNITFSSSMTITVTGTLTINAASSIRSNGKMWNSNLTLNAAVTYTLLDDLRISGTLTFTGVNRTINGFKLYMGSTLAFNAGTNVTTDGTTELVFNGTGNWSGTANRIIKNDLTFDTTGTITMTTATAYSTGKIKWINGTLVQNNVALNIVGDTTFDTSDLVWARITVVATATITLLSKLKGTLFIANNGVATFAGTSGFELTNLSFTASDQIANLYLTPGLIYKVLGTIGCNVNRAIAREFRSTVAGTRATFILDPAATCTLSFFNITDIDASGGRPVNVFLGTATNCINVNVYGDPVQTIAKSFAF